MSFRDVRAFTEAMKILGYPHLISLDNLRAPNFELVADSLHWLVHRCYPEAPIHDEISTEADRIAFLHSIAHVLASKARIALNSRRLYAADGAAVRELLKVVALVQAATAAAAKAAPQARGKLLSATTSGSSWSSTPAADPTFLSACVTNLVERGAALHDALGEEGATLREARTHALAFHPDPAHVEACISEASAQVTDVLLQLARGASDTATAEEALHVQLERRASELERVEKRLGALAGVRPAYMEQYERKQEELQGVWAGYVMRTRNLQYLRARLVAQQRAEAAAAEAGERALRKMQRQLAEEELRILRGESMVEESDLVGGGGDQSGSDSDDQLDLGTSTGPFVPRSAIFAGRTMRPAGAETSVPRDSYSSSGARQASSRVVGSLLAAELDDSVSAGDDNSSRSGAVSMGDGSDALDQYGDAVKRRSTSCSEDSGF